MPKAVIVDDDARVAHNHRALVETVPGFEVAAVVHGAAAAMQAVRDHRPDLVLLDLFLPDGSGLSVLDGLRSAERDGTVPHVDVLVVSALRDAEYVRAALHGGALHYMVKPFAMTELRDRLERYAAARRRLAAMVEASQSDIDGVLGLLRPGSASAPPKGLSAATVRLVTEALRDADGDLSAAEVAERTGIARVTARRYLEHLCADDRAALRLRYGSGGRPEHRYHLVRA
ncbi:response regulator [Nocardiopsis sp. NPDC050513]|uniref:response regulator n=1 Tax=Nocardiopsis sp. NPDC050513 TaxID=3364338 RepID=UPI003798EB25